MVSKESRFSARNYWGMLVVVGSVRGGGRHGQVCGLGALDSEVARVEI